MPHFNKLLLGSLVAISPLMVNAHYSFEDFTFLDNIGAEIDLPPENSFFGLYARYDITDRAKIEDPEDSSGQCIRYGEGDARAAITYCFNNCSAFRLTAGYQSTYLGWYENPFFETEYFNNGYINLGYKILTPCWDWQVEGSINADLELFNDFSTQYFLGAWGRYHVTDNLGTQVGFIYRGGIRQDRFWPVFGIDWQLPPYFSINIVYPINMSVAYNVTDCWSVAVVGKVINTRHRLKEQEVLSSGIFQYSNYGVELAVNYKTCSAINANIHIGLMTNGDLRISDDHNSNVVKFETEAVGYIGANLSLKY